jgi:hypothetical protein
MYATAVFAVYVLAGDVAVVVSVLTASTFVKDWVMFGALMGRTFVS